MDILTEEQLLKHLRDALNHLHDPDRLRRSPLAPAFGLAGRVNTPFLLQDLLMEGIEALRPPPGARLESQARRNYDLLLYRYVQQLDQQEVADQLGLSIRQLGREQRTALEALAGRLCRHLLPESLPCPPEPDQELPAPVSPAEPARGELDWLQNALPDEPVDLNLALPPILELLWPLANRYGATLASAVAAGTPALAVHPVALRQILINVLSSAISAAGGGRLSIEAGPSGWEVVVQVLAVASEPRGATASEGQTRNLSIADELARLCGGRLAMAGDGDELLTTLTLPAAGQVPVLVVDDNADALQLMQRYTSGTRYRLTGIADPAEALRLVIGLMPQVIVLDVMMPQMDGWELLGRLRQHPAASHVPVVICSILAQEELALSLGASAFVPKPISRQAFLAALDSQLAPAAAAPG